MASTLQPGSTVPLFISDFEGAMFFDTPQAGGGIFAVGQEDQTNILIFDDTNDVAVGGNEVDIIMAGAGDDNIMGAAGTDFMFGGLGDDIVRGGLGDDVIVGNQGSDLLISGGGSDVYEFFADQFEAGDFDIILDFEVGKDSIVVVGSTDTIYDPATGSLSVDGSVVGILTAGLDIDTVARGNSSVIS
ncbi:MAG: calcium-binding protein [Mastigocoleus sp.]